MAGRGAQLKASGGLAISPIESGSGDLKHLDPRLRDLFDRPLLLDRSRVDLLQKLAGRGAIDPQAFFWMFDFQDEDDLDIRDGVAVIPIKGGIWSWSQKTLRRRFDAAMGNAGVRGVLFDVDSPGGAVSGTFDLADYLFAARGKKPIWAIANDAAYSAAYALASVADRVSVTRSGGVGSVGVIAVHVEFSKMDERVGVTYTPIFSGERKNDFSDTEPLNDTARGLLQMEVDRLREIFVATVARNRGITAEAVRKTEAGTFNGPEGLDIKFADAVESFDETLAAFQASLNRAPAGSGAPSRRTAMADPVKTTEGKLIDLEAERAKWRGEAEQEKTAAVAAERAEREKVEADARAAREAETSRVKDIVATCNLAGMPERAGEFIESGTSVADVKAALLEAKAKASEANPVSGRHAGNPGGDEKAPTIDYGAQFRRLRGQAAKEK